MKPSYIFIQYIYVNCKRKSLPLATGKFQPQILLIHKQVW